MPSRVMCRPETYLITLHTHRVKGVEHSVCVAGRCVNNRLQVAAVNAFSDPGGSLAIVYITRFHIDAISRIAKDRYGHELCSRRNVSAQGWEGWPRAVNVSGRRV